MSRQDLQSWTCNLILLKPDPQFKIKEGADSKSSDSHILQDLSGMPY